MCKLKYHHDIVTADIVTINWTSRVIVLMFHSYCVNISHFINDKFQNTLSTNKALFSYSSTNVFIVDTSLVRNNILISEK